MNLRQAKKIATNPLNYRGKKRGLLARATNRIRRASFEAQALVCLKLIALFRGRLANFKEKP